VSRKRHLDKRRAASDNHVKVDAVWNIRTLAQEQYLLWGRRHVDCTNVALCLHFFSWGKLRYGGLERLHAVFAV
jgi:hypothetical protein